MNCFCKTTASARLWLYLMSLYFVSSAIPYCISPYASLCWAFLFNFLLILPSPAHLPAKLSINLTFILITLAVYCNRPYYRSLYTCVNPQGNQLGTRHPHKLHLSSTMPRHNLFIILLCLSTHLSSLPVRTSVHDLVRPQPYFTLTQTYTHLNKLPPV